MRNLEKRIDKLEQNLQKPEDHQAFVDKILHNLTIIYGDGQSSESMTWKEFNMIVGQSINKIYGKKENNPDKVNSDKD